MYPVMRDLIAAYRDAEPSVGIALDADSDHDGLAAFRSGDAALALVARDLLPEERDDDSILATPIGLGAVAIILNASNPIQDLELDQVRRIYAGHILGWEELGGRVGEIEIVGQEENSNTRQVMEAKIMHRTLTTLQMVIAPSSEAVVQRVGENAGAIGYVSMAWLRQGTKAIALEGIPPDRESISQGDYPLTRPLYLISAAAASEEVSAFLSFVLSPDGQRIVSRHHVPIR